MTDKQYFNGKETSEILGVHPRTLYLWDAKGLIDTIRTPGNHRLYNVKKFLDEKKCKSAVCEDLDSLDIKDNLNICYVRISSNGQKDDLERQKEMMIQKFPNHLIIEDIGSGLNLNKRGIRKIIKLAISGKVKELVVAYRDRLTRFDFELIEDIIRTYSSGRIIVLNEEYKLEPEEEIVKDIMAIMNVYVAKINGLRKYKKNKDN
jgi:predicted site-specific integrase-resolvase